MFTGIVEERGSVTAVEPGRLSVRGPLVTSDARYGDSIAVNGVCLTVTEVEGDVFTVDVMGETYKRTALGDLVVDAPVNLERALPANGRLGGHIVQGHVDGVGRIAARWPESEWETVHIDAPEALLRYIVEKGSIAVDGVSLTVAGLRDGGFTVGLIPATLAATTLGAAAVGATVHLEVDVLAKHVERLLEVRA